MGWTRAIRVLRGRPRLWGSLAVGAVVGWVLDATHAVPGAAPGLIGWNVATTLYLVLAGVMMHRADTAAMQRRALHENEGRRLVLWLAVASALAVLLAVGSQLATLKSLDGVEQKLHLLLAAWTVAGGWLFTQTLLAIHYAHDYYTIRAREHVDPLQFPGTPDPDYGDFLYFSCVIGTSGQTADVSFAHRTLRRVGLVHCVLAFVFNTTVLALTINLAASLLAPK